MKKPTRRRHTHPPLNRTSGSTRPPHELIKKQKRRASEHQRHPAKKRKADDRHALERSRHYRDVLLLLLLHVFSYESFPPSLSFNPLPCILRGKERIAEQFRVFSTAIRSALFQASLDRWWVMVLGGRHSMKRTPGAKLKLVFDSGRWIWKFYVGV